MYLAGYAETTIANGAKITGSNTGIEIRAGKLIVNGGTITGNAVPTESDSNGNGATTVGAGIAVAQHTTKLPIDVQINGGEINGYTALYEKNTEENGAEDIAKVSVTVNDGKFAAINGGVNAVYSEDCVKFLKGGHYTSDPTAFKAENYYVLPSTEAGYNYMVTANVPVIPVTPSEPAKNPFNLEAGKNSVKFADVSDNAWYASAVNYAVDKGLMNGTGDNKFSPEADTTRGMIVTILARLDGKNTSGTPWYQAGQRWAMEYEISDGTKMESAITREQLVTMLFRYAVKNGLEAVTLAENLSQFTDASDVSSWAVPAMQWAVGQGLIQGSNGQLRPQANASRAEVATILMRFCELLNK